jgi:DNA-binding FadR family transcriptional regulator
MRVTMRAVKCKGLGDLQLHEHVAAEIRRDIVNGDVSPGERLRPARDMAAVLGVLTNTVFRALRVLRGEGVLESRRGRGVGVSSEPERGLIQRRHRAAYAGTPFWNAPR